MAKRQSTSTAQTRRKAASESKRVRAPAKPPTNNGFNSSARHCDSTAGQPIERVIENERARLDRAQSILKCLRTALVYAEERDGAEPGHADVAEAVLRLIREAVNQLDSVFIKPLLVPEGGPAPERKRTATDKVRA